MKIHINKVQVMCLRVRVRVRVLSRVCSPPFFSIDGDVPKYRSLGAMQPAFFGEFSRAPKYRSSFNNQFINQDPTLQAAHHQAALQAALFAGANGDRQPQEPIWRSMGAFSDFGNFDASRWPSPAHTPAPRQLAAATSSPRVWDAQARHAAAYSGTGPGAHANFLLAFGAHLAEPEREDADADMVEGSETEEDQSTAEERSAMQAVTEAVRHFESDLPCDGFPNDDRWSVHATIRISSSLSITVVKLLTTPTYNGERWHDLPPNTARVSVRLYRFDASQSDASQSNNHGTGVYGMVGVGPPVRVVHDNFASSTTTDNKENEARFVLSICRLEGDPITFETFVSQYKNALRGERTTTTTTPAQTNLCAKGGEGGYLALDHELYPGSLVLMPEKATQHLLMAAPPAPVPADMSDPTVVAEAVDDEHNIHSNELDDRHHQVSTPALLLPVQPFRRLTHLTRSLARNGSRRINSTTRPSTRGRLRARAAR